MVEAGMRGNLPLLKRVLRSQQLLAEKRRGAVQRYARPYDKAKVDKLLRDDEAVIRWAMRAFPKTGFTNYLCAVVKLKPVPLSYFSDRDETYIPIGLLNNQNVINQEGVFTWNTSPDYPIEHIVREQVLREYAVSSHVYTHCLNINKALITCLMNRLQVLGITDEFILPEQDQQYLRGLVQEIFTVTANAFS